MSGLLAVYDTKEPTNNSLVCPCFSVSMSEIKRYPEKSFPKGKDEKERVNGGLGFGLARFLVTHFFFMYSAVYRYCRRKGRDK